MSKGFLKGVFWGGVFSVGASVVAVMLDREGISHTTASSGNRLTSLAEEGPDAAASSGSVTAGLAAQDTSAPKPDTLAGLVSETLTPAAVPSTSAEPDIDGTLHMPQVSGLSAVVPSDTEPPRIGFDTRGALETPTTDSGLAISRDPAQPVAPDPAPATTAFDTAGTTGPEAPQTPQDPVAEFDATLGTTSSDVSVSGKNVATVALDPAQPPVPRLVEDSSALGTALVDPEKQHDVTAALDKDVTAKSAGGITPTLDAGPAPAALANVPQQPIAAPEAIETIAALPVEEFVPEQAEIALLPAPESTGNEAPEAENASARVRVETDITPPDATVVAAARPAMIAPSISPVLETPAAQRLEARPADDSSVSLEATQSAPAVQPEAAPEPQVAVQVNRLPNVATADTNAPTDGASDATQAEPIDPAVLTPFDQFAAAFENPDNKPVLGIVLVDDGADLADPGTSMEVLRALSFPVSFAVDALLPDASDRMQVYRAAGFEVLALVDLPAGATAGDAEVNLSVALNALPEAMAVLGGVETGVQTTPDAGRQVAQILAQSGHGLVTQNRGLNTAQKLAARAGVPAAIVFRDFDGAGQPSVVMHRNLDQAVFRAVQDGGAILLGRVRDDTLNALGLWRQQERASRVALGPVSAVMRKEVELP